MDSVTQGLDFTSDSLALLALELTPQIRLVINNHPDKKVQAKMCRAVIWWGWKRDKLRATFARLSTLRNWAKSKRGMEIIYDLEELQEKMWESIVALDHFGEDHCNCPGCGGW